MPVLLYSGGCKFCRWTARAVVRRLDITRRLEMLPFRNGIAQTVLEAYGVAAEERHLNWWFVDSELKLWAGNKGGGLALLSELPLTWPLAIVIKVLGLGRLLDKLDDWVKAHRPQLSPYVKDGPAVYIMELPAELEEKMSWTLGSPSS